MKASAKLLSCTVKKSMKMANQSIHLQTEFFNKYAIQIYWEHQLTFKLISYQIGKGPNEKKARALRPNLPA